jgi:phage-related protein
MAPGEELVQVRDFIDRHEGYKSFLWTPPGGVQGRYRCNGYKTKPLGASLWTLSFTFKQTFTA